MLQGSPEYLLLQRPVHYGSIWQPVTGHVEDGESTEAAALREVTEELSFAGCTLIDLGLTYTFAKKDKTYEEQVFASDSKGQKPTLSHEHIAMQWMNYAQAHVALPYADQKKALERLQSRLTA